MTLIKHGHILRHNLRRELLTEDELQSQLRQSGIDDIAAVKHAHLEPDGHISVIPFTSEAHRPRRGGMPGAG